MGMPNWETTVMPRTPFRRLIIADIIRQIRAGELQPGDRLPSHPQLALQYGCSVEPVRAALAWLEARGWVEAHQGRGVYVSEHPPTG